MNTHDLRVGHIHTLRETLPCLLPMCRSYKMFMKSYRDIDYVMPITPLVKTAAILQS